MGDVSKINNQDLANFVDLFVGGSLWGIALPEADVYCSINPSYRRVVRVHLLSPVVRGSNPVSSCTVSSVLDPTHRERWNLRPAWRSFLITLTLVYRE